MNEYNVGMESGLRTNIHGDSSMEHTSKLGNKSGSGKILMKK